LSNIYSYVYIEREGEREKEQEKARDKKEEVEISDVEVWGGGYSGRISLYSTCHIEWQQGVDSTKFMQGSFAKATWQLLSL